MTLSEAKTSSDIRMIMLREFGNKCAICTIERWCGEIAPVEVDHIDGDSRNNSIKNLRLLCCNCHAQTPTYRSKNYGNGRPGRRKSGTKLGAISTGVEASLSN
jgi:HNH endonuclease